MAASAVDPKMFADLMDDVAKLNPELARMGDLVRAASLELSHLGDKILPVVRAAIDALSRSGTSMGQALTAGAAIASGALAQIGSAVIHMASQIVMSSALAVEAVGGIGWAGVLMGQAVIASAAGASMALVGIGQAAQVMAAQIGAASAFAMVAVSGVGSAGATMGQMVSAGGAAASGAMVGVGHSAGVAAAGVAAAAAFAAKQVHAAGVSATNMFQAFAAAMAAATAAQNNLTAGMGKLNSAIAAATANLEKVAKAGGGVGESGRKFGEAMKRNDAAVGKLQRNIGQLAEAVRGLGTIFTAVGAVSTAAILGMVSVSNPGVYYQWTMAMTQLSGVIGGMFMPVIQTVIPLIRQFNDWMWNLPATSRAVIATFGIASVVIVTGLGAITTAIIVTNVALTVFNSLMGGILLIIGGAVTAMVALGAAATIVGASYGFLGDAAKRFGTMMDEVWGKAGQMVAVAWEHMIKPAMDNFAAVLSEFGKYAWMMWPPIEDAFASIMAATHVLADDMGATLVGAAEQIAIAFRLVADAISFVIDFAMKAMLVIQTLMKKNIADLIFDPAAVFDEIEKKLAAHEKHKKEIKKELNKPPERKEKAKAPEFGQQSVMSGISEAKELFWKASMQASAGQDPQIKAAREIKDEVAAGNKILKQMQDAFGVNRPIAGGVGP